jgi:hypothetical protein
MVTAEMQAAVARGAPVRSPRPVEQGKQLAETRMAV